LAGALHLPLESSVNCRQFASLLRLATRRYDVQWRFDTTVLALAPGKPVHVLSQAEGMAPQQEAFDHVVVCAGVASGPLLAALGVRLPLLAVRGYSISAPVREPLNAPFATVLDERHQVVISRLENRVRVSGISEIGGHAPLLSERRLNSLYQLLNDWFPGAAITSGAVQQWKGARHALPDGLPIVGPSGLDGIFLNLGQGDAGWALACGCALLLSAQLQGRPDDMSSSAFQLHRLQ
jgi:D-amino-acid dehydrogenase